MRSATLWTFVGLTAFTLFATSVDAQDEKAEDQPIKQIQLTDKQVQSFLSAQKH